MLRNTCVTVLLVTAFAQTAMAQAPAPITGQWTISTFAIPPVQDVQQVQLTIRRTAAESSMSSSSSIPITQLRDLRALGVRLESTNQLITMRIHNVTPEFIRDIRARGLGTLSIDQLVNLRIHRVLE